MEHLKIIKTHTNLSSIDVDGLYEVIIPFTNSFNSTLNGVVVEDIIPLNYIHIFKEPTNLLPAHTSTSEIGNIVQWNIDSIEAGTLNFHYKLLEGNKFEELKVKIDTIDLKGVEAVNNGNINEALQYYKEIKELLLNYIN